MNIPYFYLAGRFAKLLDRFPTTVINDYYVGITSDIQQRFIDHNIQNNSPTWDCVEFSTTDEAREAEKLFLTYGCDGGSGGGNDKSRTLYFYLKRPQTRR